VWGPKMHVVVVAHSDNRRSQKLQDTVGQFGWSDSPPLITHQIVQLDLAGGGTM